VLTTIRTCDNIIPVQEKGGRSPMIKNKIKRLVRAYQAKRLAKSRIDNNHKNINLILQGLKERGY